MQVKHPPNQITAVYNVTSTTSNTSLIYSGARSRILSVVIDGEDKGQIASYKFSEIGDHEVQFIIPKGAFDATEFFNNMTQLISVDFSEFRSNVTYASKLFYNCSKLTSVTNFNPAGMTNMIVVFMVVLS